MRRAFFEQLAAAEGTRGVVDTVESVNRSAADDVLTAADRLAEKSERMRGEVDRFPAGIREAYPPLIPSPCFLGGANLT